MSLRTKTVIVSVLVMLGFVVAVYLTASRVLSQGFARVEHDAVERSVRTLEGHMPFEVAVVAEKLGTFASVEDLAAFAARPDPAFAARRLSAERVRAAELSFAAVFDAEGRSLHTAVAQGAPGDREVQEAWQRARGADATPRGLLQVGDATAIVASTPLERPGDAARVGTLFVGRVIDADLIRQIESLTHLEIDMRPYGAEDLPPPFARARRAIDGGTARPIEPVDENTIVGFTRLRDVGGAPVLLVRVATPRPIAQQARESRTALLLGTAGVGSVLVVAVVALLQWGLLPRFLRMSRSVRRIAAEQDASLRVRAHGSDELGQLGRDVNAMLDSLQASQKALRESEARYALVARGANDGMWDWDLELGEVLYSARFLALLGEPAEDTRDGPELWRGRMHSDDLPRFEAKLARFRQGQSRFFEDEHRLCRADGRWRWMLARGAATPAEGRPVRIAGSLTDITERGVFDPATGLPNRVLLRSRLAQAAERAREGTGSSVAVVALGLERFKAVTDGLGAQAVERVSTEIARRLQSGLRAGDMIARLGGEDFVAVLEDAGTAEQVLGVLEGVRAAMSKPLALGGATVHMPVTAGVVMDLARYDRPDEAIDDAVLARDQARRAGQRVAWFDPEMQRRIAERQRTESELRTAIEGGRLALHYQPIVDLETGGVYGFEALVRWPHPTRGLLAPAAFVELAEETGLIVPLGAWVLHEAIRVAARWSSAAGPREGPMMHINLSAKQLLASGLVDTVRGALAEHEVDPARVELEVTESVMITHGGEAAEVLAQLRRVGVRLAVDDFGTGHSSLAYLHDLPVQTLKVDRSFVFRMTEDVRSRKIVHTIVQLGNGLGMDVVGEGIETEAHLDAVRAAGVRLAQGYYFAKPLPLEQAEQWRARVRPVS
ncbi:MAG: EAL domain-containing protein [Trueperaceae bacterium]|nr:EAL domain-containing protein [Trueperaceae bacterium]